MSTKTDTVVKQLREHLAAVEAQFKPLEQERERLLAMIAAADGKLKLDGTSSETGTRTRKASVPLQQVKNRVSHLVKQKPNESGAFYRRQLEDIPGNTVDAALKELVTAKKLTAKGERKARRYASAS